MFDIIPIEGPRFDHPDFATGDLNLLRRGFQPVAAALTLVPYNGPTDSDAPQLSAIFQPRRVPFFRAAYQVNSWQWSPADCRGSPHGCAGPPVTRWEVTLLGVSTTPGELLTIPSRAAEIYPGGYRAMVLYADEQQITLGYTRRDTVAAGYVVHLLGVCVDPNLLALYRAQVDANGWRVGNSLPALRTDQPLGHAAGKELRIAIRDNGTFLDPRSQKDWWR
ncbi:MAG: hypothetical protein D6784_08370 [Chloroflexi bacterium]|nr:MAG: hypothetical protein D6784_08370 [Chloroflexota bacterium]